MLEKLLFAIPALAIGAGVALQGIINAGLARGIGSYVVAAATSFWVGTLTLTALALASGSVGGAVTAGRGVGLGWWIAGGLLGAAYVTMMTVIVPKIGIGAATAFVIAGQLITAALLDHFGVLGVSEHPLTLLRMLGIALLIAGALLVRFF
ncbi:DMT family transporter [Hansschlegelia zhihuaiae]|uniref:DMT family transporter n=1 Tax=Hansschlegelia zhihuaiae TaxID=405005 RepID=A0A4Q0MMX8_9HYPH|nr:DMT family transporter [Hansschlegelia zhihuaiae]RXF74963.1 DMT family transporter [Hansschlegelia zhihuaiae]